MICQRVQKKTQHAALMIIIMAFFLWHFRKYNLIIIRNDKTKLLNFSEHLLVILNKNVYE